MNNITLRKLVFAGVLATLSLLSFMLENLFPPLFIPGARMGISNVFILLALVFLGDWYAVAVFIIKTTFGSLFAGNLAALIYSLPSGAIALLCEILLIKCAKFSIISISLVGSIINILCQGVIFCLVTSMVGYFTYFPYLAIIGFVSGIMVGTIVFLAIKFIPEKFIKLFDDKNSEVES